MYCSSVSYKFFFSAFGFSVENESAALPYFASSSRSSSPGTSTPTVHTYSLYKKPHSYDCSSRPSAPFSYLPGRPCVPPPPVPPASAPSAPPSTPEDSPTVGLTFGTRKLSSIIFDDNGIPTLDLHNMTVPEAKSAVQGFLRRQRSLGSSYIQIITGRGIHSDNGIPKIKPVVKNIIVGEGLQYRETCKGGSYLVYL